MKLVVVHLSDIHIKSASDDILRRASDIASTCFDTVRVSDGCIICVTGDVSFSGTTEQLTAASGFLNSIRVALAQEITGPVDVFVVPGNHDCQLLPENRSRTLVIKAVIEEPELAADANVIEDCTSCLEPFAVFQRSITLARAVESHPLWQEYEFEVGGKLVRISGVNAAWMSRLPEVQGELVFPVDLFQTLLSEPCNLRLALLHHPLNWYTQATYHPLRKALRSYAHAVLTGHEHAPASGSVTESNVGESCFYEAAALQPENVNDNAGFSVLTFDLDSRNVHEQRYDIGAVEIRTREESEQHLPQAHLGKTELDLTDAFEDYLRDPGGNFTQVSRKTRIELDDVFVYPELRAQTAQRDELEATAANTLIEGDPNRQFLLLLGDDKAGKSVLLLRAFRDYHRRGLCPIFMSAARFVSFSERELKKVVDDAIRTEYARPEAVSRSVKERRVLLLDDVDLVRGGARSLARLLSYIDKSFGGIIATASSGFEFAEIVQKDAAEALKKFDVYQIKPFGHRLRHDLIKKWCICGSVSSTVQLDQRVHAAESLLDSVVGKSLVPCQPIFLLILLQTQEESRPTDLQSSSFSHYYQYLITKSLGEAGVKAEHLNELFNYLAHLAWFYRSSELQQATLHQLREFNQIFSGKFVSVDLEARLQLLRNARVVSKVGDCYQFQYSYIFHFFLGKYLADRIDQPEIRSIVGDWCTKLHRRENANAILFLTHHRNDPWVIEEVSKVLRACFSEHAAMQFDTDVVAINSLVDAASQLLIEEPNIEHNQRAQRAARDEWDDREDLNERRRQEPGAQQEMWAIVDEVYLLLRTAEILGRIVKNYYGSIERPTKRELMKEVVNAPLRLLRLIVDSFESSRTSLVSEIERGLEAEHPSIKPEQKKEMAREIGYRIWGMLSTGAIAKSAELLASDKLEEDIADLAKENPTNAYRLVEAATHLLKPGHLPIDLIGKLARDLKGNPFAFTILQSLGAHHIHLFHTSVAEKQQLCEYLKLTMAESRAIDRKGTASKVLQDARDSKAKA